MGLQASRPQQGRIDQVATVSLGSTPTSISRRDGERIVSVPADADETPGLDAVLRASGRHGLEISDRTDDGYLLPDDVNGTDRGRRADRDARPCRAGPPTPRRR